MERISKAVPNRFEIHFQKLLQIDLPKALPMCFSMLVVVFNAIQSSIQSSFRHPKTHQKVDPSMATNKLATDIGVR